MNTTHNYGMAALAVMLLILGTSEVRRAYAVTPLSQNFPQTSQQPNRYRPGVTLANSQMPALGNPHVKYGLVQTGVFGVSRTDQNGRFGTPTPMPVFQLIQLQAPQTMSALQSNARLQAMPRGLVPTQPTPTTRTQPQATLPPGITVSQAPATPPTATQCRINSVLVLTKSIQACAAAGGQAKTPLQ